MAAIWQWLNFDLSLTFNDQGTVGIADRRSLVIPPPWNLQRVIATWADVASPAGVVGGQDYNLIPGLWLMSLEVARGSTAEMPFYQIAWPMIPTLVQASRDALGIFWNGSLIGGPQGVDTDLRRTASVVGVEGLQINWTFQYQPNAAGSNPVQVAKMLHTLVGSMRVLLSHP